MHIPITVSNKKIPKGTRIIKQKLTKKINTKEGKKNHYTFGGGEGSPAGWKAKGHQKCHKLNVAGKLKRRQRSAVSRLANSERRDLRAERCNRRALSVAIELHRRRFTSLASPLSFIGDSWLLMELIGDGGSFIGNARSLSVTVGFFPLGFFRLAWFFFFFFFLTEMLGLKCFVICCVLY